jgi:hypothetical protein
LIKDNFAPVPVKGAVKHLLAQFFPVHPQELGNASVVLGQIFVAVPLVIAAMFISTFTAKIISKELGRISTSVP